jgi:hypothetical protein
VQVKTPSPTKECNLYPLHTAQILYPPVIFVHLGKIPDALNMCAHNWKEGDTG